MTAAGHMYSPEQLHQVRIAAKKLRYAMELAFDGGVKSAAAPVRAVKRAQDTLGRLHDLQVLQSHVAAVQAEPSGRSLPDGGLDMIAARSRTSAGTCTPGTSRRCPGSPTSWRRRAPWSCPNWRIAPGRVKMTKMTLKARPVRRRDPPRQAVRRARRVTPAGRRRAEVVSAWRHWSCI